MAFKQILALSIILASCFKSENQPDQGPKQAAFSDESFSISEQRLNSEEPVSKRFRIANRDLELFASLEDVEPICIIPAGSVLGFATESLTFRLRNKNADLYHNPFISLICGDVKQGWIR